jgi:hypothetical protein
MREFNRPIPIENSFKALFYSKNLRSKYPAGSFNRGTDYRIQSRGVTSPSENSYSIHGRRFISFVSSDSRFRFYVMRKFTTSGSTHQV